MSEPALFDSNILIDFLKDIEAAGAVMDRFEADRAINVITWIEVLAGPVESEAAARVVLARFELLTLSHSIADAAVAIRRTTRLKLPDAIILATTRAHGRVIVSRNTKDFRAGDPGILVPYTL